MCTQARRWGSGLMCQPASLQETDGMHKGRVKEESSVKGPCRERWVGSRESRRKLDVREPGVGNGTVVSQLTVPPSPHLMPLLVERTSCPFGLGLHSLTRSGQRNESRCGEYRTYMEL